MKRPVLSFLATIIATTLSVVWGIDWIVLPILGILCLVLIVKRKEAGLIVMNLFFLLLSFFMTHYMLDAATGLDSLHATDVTITAQAIDYPEYTDGRTRAVFQILTVEEMLGYDDEDRLLLSIYEDAPVDIVPGGIYTITGRLKVPDSSTNPGGFDYRFYLQTKGIHLTMWTTQDDFIFESSEHLTLFYDQILTIRTFCVATIHRYLPDMQADVLCAILFGTDDMDTAILQDFREIGIAHILAVSGLHVGIIYLFFGFLLRILRTPKKMRFVIMTVILLLYVVLTGMSISVIRASLMLWFLLLAERFDKKTDSFQYVCLAALIILLVNPLALFSVSFQLSFAAVLSIVLFFPIVQNRIKNPNRFVKKILEYITITLIVQISLMPIIAYYFHTLSLIALIANIMIVPFVSIVLIGGLLGLIGSFFPPFASALFSFVNVLLDYMIGMAAWLSRLSFSSVEVRSPKWYWLIVFYLLLFIVFGYLNRKKRYAKIMFAVVISAAVVFYTLTWFPPSHTRVSFLDVGLGDCVLIETDKGETILIDGGGYLSNDTATYDILPYLDYYNIRSIDMMIATHSDSDHCRGLVDLVGQVPIRTIYANDDGGTLYLDLLEKADTFEIPLMAVQKGDIITLSGGSLTILNPDNTLVLSQNNESIAILAQLNGYKILLTSDLEYRGLKQILDFYDLSDIDVLKVPHHGSYAGNLDDLLEETDPIHSVISVGPNGYHLPNEKTLDLIAEYDTVVYRTDETGCVTFYLRKDGIITDLYLRK